MSRGHAPSQNTSYKGNTSNYSKPATLYKAIMPPSNKAGEAARKVHAIMAELDNKDLEKAKNTFIESLDEDIVEEESKDFQ